MPKFQFSGRAKWPLGTKYLVPPQRSQKIIVNQSKPILVIVSIKPFTRQSFVLHAKLNGRFLLRQPLKNTLRTEPIQILIRQYMERNTEDDNISLENALKILTETSKLCLKIKAKKT